jgi:hypothetical protein
MGIGKDDEDRYWTEYGGRPPMNMDQNNNPVVGRYAAPGAQSNEMNHGAYMNQRPKHPDFNIVKASDSTLVHIKGLIMGDSGAGKSYLIATAPNPLVLLTEPNGAMSIQASNPDALIIHITDLNHMKAVLAAIRDGAIKQPFDTIVIDSITELQRMIQFDILAEANKKGKDKRETLSKQDYGKLANRFTELITKIRNLPYHLICTCLVSIQVIDENTGLTEIRPMLVGQAKMTVAQYFNGVGFLYRTGKYDEYGSAERALLLDGIERVKVKPFPNTVGTMKDPNLCDLFNNIIEGSNG